MSDLDEQIRTYYQAIIEPVDVQHPATVKPMPGQRRVAASKGPLVAAGAAAIIIAAIAAPLLLTQGETDSLVDLVVPVTENIDIESLTWTRLPLEDSESTPQAVVEFDGGLVAVGDGMAWSSDDGETWTEASLPGTEPSPSLPWLDVDVVVGGPGLVAVGSSPQDGLPAGAAVWTSPDGSRWNKAPGQPKETGGGTLSAVIEAGPRLVAVGAGQVFTSEDGLTWTAASQNLRTEPPFFGWLTDVTIGGPGLVAVGSQGNAAVWTSPDGLAWSRVPNDDEVFGWDWVHMNAVAAGGPGLVAVGHGPPDPTDPEERTGLEPGMAWVWTSPDGLSWSRVPHDEAVFGNAAMLDVIAVGDTLIAVGGGWAHDLTGPEFAAVWTSRDGLSWQRLPHVGVFDGPAMTSITQYQDGLVAVGDGAVWMATTPADTEPARADSQELPGSDQELGITPVDWAVTRDVPLTPRGSMHMVAEVGPLTPDWVSSIEDGSHVSGSLIWEETQIELCNLYVRDITYEILESGSASTFMQVGDIFSLSDGTGLCHRAALESAWSEYGPPDEGCIMVSTPGVPDPISYCGQFETQDVLEGRG